MVLPVHNGARYLDAAIASVRAQSFPDFELICVDDCSSDDSPAILARHAGEDERVRVVRNAQNKGLPASLNRGFAEARAALHSWTSDDNELGERMLDILHARLSAHRDCDVVYAGYDVIDEHGAYRRTVMPSPPGELLYRNGVGAAFLYRAEVGNALGGYDEGLFGVEDYDFWLRAARRFRLCPVEQTLYRYRRHPRSLTDRREREIAALLRRILLREIDLEPDRSRRAKALVNLMALDDKSVRLDLIGKALATDPAVLVRGAPLIGDWAKRYAARRVRGLRSRAA